MTLFAIAVASVTLATTTASGDGLTIDPAVTNARAKLKARVFAQEEGLKRRARVAGYRLLIEDLKAKPRLTAGEQEDLAALVRLLATETERSKR
ncbi:hypothetical protein EON81_22200 [bacterium]|nr:MAG: hypothetical protein EON81_22200 [bacterium]